MYVQDGGAALAGLVIGWEEDLPRRLLAVRGSDDDLLWLNQSLRREIGGPLDQIGDENARVGTSAGTGNARTAGTPNRSAMCWPGGKNRRDARREVEENRL